MSGASAFADMLEGALSGNQSAGLSLGSSKAATSHGNAYIDHETLSDALGNVLGALNVIDQAIKAEEPVAQQSIEELLGLLETVSDLLDENAIIDPDSPLIGHLRDIAKSLGLETGGSASAPQAILETISDLATKIGAELRETNPQISAGLSELASKLDAKIASIETELANAAPDAGIRLKLVESETKSNPSAAIAQATSDKAASQSLSSVDPADQQIEADKAESTRTLAGANPDNQPNTGSGQSQAGGQGSGAATSAAAATVASTNAETQSEAPDGLIIAPGQTNATNAAQGAMRPETAAYTRPEPRINVPHIAVEIARSLQSGISRFEIRLNPPELGRIDVRLEMDPSGNVTARLAVEKSETLDLLQRDQRALERALIDAGLDGNKTDLEFSLRQDGDNQNQTTARDTWKAAAALEPEISELPAQLPGGPIRGYARLDAVNLWV